MKRIAIFIGLKIAEVAVIVLLPYLVGVIFIDESGVGAWLAGVLLLLVPMAGFGLIIVVAVCNWELTNKLAPYIRKRTAIIIAGILIVSAVVFLVLHIPSPQQEDIELVDTNDITITWEPYPLTLEIATTSGGELILEIWEDELKITGDANMNEGAAVFFNQYIKNIADRYIKQKLKGSEGSKR
jgi:hypothetical protein